MHIGYKETLAVDSAILSESQQSRFKTAILWKTEPNPESEIDVKPTRKLLCA